MLTSAFRFHGHGSLRFVYSRGKVIRSDYFISKVTSNRRRQRSRFAVVVSKKVMKSAVGRNRIRRRIYESIRRQCDMINEPVDLVVIVTSSNVAGMPAAELEIAVTRVMMQCSPVVK